MFEQEIAKYQKLNTLVEGGGTVIFGCGKDTEIPIAELAEAFGLNTLFYNRSVEYLSLQDAIWYYAAVIAPLAPERVILHIGSIDTEFFKNAPSEFDTTYRKLIECIRSYNPTCNIGIVSLKNEAGEKNICELNRHLRMIAESERCEFEDISIPRVWNPKATKSAMSFAFSMGLSLKTNARPSLYDLAKIFFCAVTVPIYSGV